MLSSSLQEYLDCKTILTIFLIIFCFALFCFIVERYNREIQNLEFNYLGESMSITVSKCMISEANPRPLLRNAKIHGITPF